MVTPPCMIFNVYIVFLYFMELIVCGKSMFYLYQKLGTPFQMAFTVESPEQGPSRPARTH